MQKRQIDDLKIINIDNGVIFTFKKKYKLGLASVAA